MSPLIKFPRKFSGKLSAEDILRSIKKVELRNGCLAIIFQCELEIFYIRNVFAKYFEISFLHKKQEDDYFSAFIYDMGKTIVGSRLSLSLSRTKGKKQRKILPFISRTDTIKISYVFNEDIERELKLLGQ